MRFTSLFKTLHLIYTHPLNQKYKFQAIFLFFKWQLRKRLSPNPITIPLAQKSHLLLHKELKGALQTLLYGLDELEDMVFLLHFLRPEDQFVDVGANVGTYTLLAANEIGANTIAIEPIPNTFNYLKKNIRINQLSDKVRALNIGLGSKSEHLNFTSDLDTTNHVQLKNPQNTISLEIMPFDEVVKIRKTSLVKIDVEGFETAVLQGMKASLKNPNLQAIIIELNGSGKKYGYEDDAIHQQLIDAGFCAYSYAPSDRRLIPKKELSNTGNSIYLKDLEFASKRIQAANKIKIRRQEF